MDYSKTIIASLLLQIIFTQAEDICTRQDEKVVCNGNMSNLKSAVEIAEQESPAPTELTVQRTTLAQLQAKSTTAKYKKLNITENAQLTTIDPMAFSSSVHTATHLYIGDCPLLRKGVWELVSKMTVLENLFLCDLGLTHLPTDAFKPLSSLSELLLSSNQLTTFDVSLEGLKLKALYLDDNNLSIECFSKSVLKNLGSLKGLYLWNNRKMTQLSKAQFKGLLDADTRVWVGRSDKGLSDKYMQCVGAEWLCDQYGSGVYKYETQVIGYECADKPGTIFDYCKSRKQ